MDSLNRLVDLFDSLAVDLLVVANMSSHNSLVVDSLNRMFADSYLAVDLANMLAVSIAAQSTSDYAVPPVFFVDKPYSTSTADFLFPFLSAPDPSPDASYAAPFAAPASFD